jgi:hypothetical protein
MNDDDGWNLLLTLTMRVPLGQHTDPTLPSAVLIRAEDKARFKIHFERPTETEQSGQHRPE